MAKFILLLVALALVATSNNKIIGAAAAAADEDADLAQRKETMAEAVRVFCNPKLAAAADSDTVERVGLFMKREMGPLGPVFEAIRKMPASSAKDEAFDAALDLLIRHLVKLMPRDAGSCARTGEL